MYYKRVLILHFTNGMRSREIFGTTGDGKTTVNEFLKRFRECEVLLYLLPERPPTNSSQTSCTGSTGTLSILTSPGIMTRKKSTVPRQRKLRRLSTCGRRSSSLDRSIPNCFTYKTLTPMSSLWMISQIISTTIITSGLSKKLMGLIRAQHRYQTLNVNFTKLLRFASFYWGIISF